MQLRKQVGCHDRMEIFTWSLTSVLMLTGLAGIIVPVLPGNVLILLAAMLHRWLLPETISWMAIGWIGALCAVSIVADFGGTILGARLFGGGKWGMAGAGMGAFIGMFFSLPALILGTIFGAVAAEKFIAKKSGRTSLLAGVGAATGFVVSTVVRLACALAMIGVFLNAALSAKA
ncbi:MAG: DUF456 domain-containing protein [Opitutaceae bacterium]